MGNCVVIVFAGDISSNVKVTIKFYEDFVKYNDYLYYKNKKKKLLNLQCQKKSIEIKKKKLESKIYNLSKYIDKLKFDLLRYLNFNIVIQYKNRYYSQSFYSWKTVIETYKELKSYKKKNISEQCNPFLDEIAKNLDLLNELELEHSRFIEKYNNQTQEFSDIENLYNKSIENLMIYDVYKKHHLLSEERKIFVVLGNHEYIGFNSVEDAVAYYEQAFSYLGIKLLHNNYYEFYTNEKHCVIFGGTGFAKYNPKYNANTLDCCNNFTRDEEIKQTSMFEKSYFEAKQIAKNKKSCFICISHYPIQDCSTIIDSDTIYFYGHNHQNYYNRNEKEIIYADNQIGYKNSTIEFTTMTTGTEINPYFSLADGLYKTTIKDYLQFYRYIGESVGDGSLLYQRCQNDKAKIYVIKRKGYYGFFIMNPNKGASRGISIINGGKTKKITKSTDLQWLFNNFEVVLSKYLQILVPLRLAQEEISKELRDLGFDGTIHGCIIDVDYYHHIMLNPVDGTMTYYYSSEFGKVLPLLSFDKVILSIQKNDVNLFLSKRDYNLLNQKFNELRYDSNYLLGKVNESYLLQTTNEISSGLDTEEQVVSRTDGMYGISQKINPLQRLFSGHTLRDFDLKLVETQPMIESNDESIREITLLM